MLLAQGEHLSAVHLFFNKPLLFDILHEPKEEKLQYFSQINTIKTC